MRKDDIRDNDSFVLFSDVDDQESSLQKRKRRQPKIRTRVLFLSHKNYNNFTIGYK